MNREISKLRVRVQTRLPESAKMTVRRARAVRNLMPAYIYDLKRYWEFSSSLGQDRHKTNLQAAIVERYHSVEKGLSLPNPRPAFGTKVLNRLLDLTDTYTTRFGDDELVSTVSAVLENYLEFNDKLGVESCDIPHYQRIVEFLSRSQTGSTDAGTRIVFRQDVVDATSAVKFEFFGSRSSVRQYSDEQVSTDEIRFATEVALKAPAVCNRQFGKVYAYTGRATIDSLLSIQGGASGFGSELSGLAIITTNLRAYWNAGQRNQAWIDGGLFAMSFILGLHSQGIGTVCLNWSKAPKKDQELRRETEIGEEEAIIMMVGFGKLRSEYLVAASNRQSVDSALTIDHAARNVCNSDTHSVIK